MSQKLTQLLLFVLSLTFLVTCGGGGGSGSSAPAPEDKSILSTNFTNPSFNPSGTTWSNDVCLGTTFFATELSDITKFNKVPYQWTSVLDPASEYEHEGQLVGVTGIAVLPELSPKDMPFTHPFGKDYMLFIAMEDPQYNRFLAPNNSNRNPEINGNKNEYADGINHAIDGLHLNVKGVFGVETDKALIPEYFRARDGDNVAVFGRWIVDCGHDDFHTEIHPPLIFAAARKLNKSGTGPGVDVTHSTVVGRPYLVSQLIKTVTTHWYKDDETNYRTLANQLLNELNNAGWQWEAPATLWDKPFEGSQSISYIVKPPAPRNNPNDKLIARYKFIVRDGVDVSVYPSFTTDAVTVVISMDAGGYKQAPVNGRDLTVKIGLNATVAGGLKPDDWRYWDPDINDKFLAAVTAWALSGGGIFPNPVWTTTTAALFANGIKTKTFEDPISISKYDSEAVPRLEVAHLGATQKYVDNDQSFPVTGWLDLEWERSSDITCTTPQTVCGTSCVDTTSDAANCGSCGNKCPNLQHCSSGSCVGGAVYIPPPNPCATGFSSCSGVCVDINSDAANCGGCGNACPSTMTCSNKTCAGGGSSICVGRLTMCSGVCVDFVTDSNNCGACGNKCGISATGAPLSCRDALCLP